MRILVTGSEGTLGVPLVKELRARGHTVWGCDLQHHGDDEFVRADVGIERQISKAFWSTKPELVFHLAADDDGPVPLQCGHDRAGLHVSRVALDADVFVLGHGDPALLDRPLVHPP